MPALDLNVAFDDSAWTARDRPAGALGSHLSVVASAAELGPAMAVWNNGELRVTVDVESDRGSASLPLPLRVTETEGSSGDGYVVSGSQYNLSLAFEFEIGSPGGEIRWQLEPSGRDAAGRAAVLDLLIAMSGRGVLTLTDSSAGAIGRFELEGGSDISDLESERRFLTDVLAVEAWSGQRLPVPADLEETEARTLAEVAYWARTRQMRVRMTSPVKMTAVPTEPSEDANEGTLELRLHETLERMLFGVWVTVGQVNYAFPAKLISAKQAVSGWDLEFESLVDWFTATIDPPTGADAPARVDAVYQGVIPAVPAKRAIRPSSRARREAERYVAALETEDGDDEILDEIRRRWPT